ncbi:maleylpyruvate isomerase family mycothiol-dependent enzyme [Streptomyces sannanensis]|uniref:Maleylpyruvate isomerase family mycothiol-dependent enzyme n=1 Tax=Streptomyces sannanensis TaxID=285536 RepID=A0ABP6SC72_9ACTN
MPAARKRTRRYDSAKIRAAVLAQFEHVRAAVLTLTPEQLALPTRLGGWTVRDLATHLTVAVESISRNIDRPEPPKQEVTLMEWPFATAAVAGKVRDDTRKIAAEWELDELYTRVAARIAERLPATPDQRLIQARVGAMPLGDFLVTRTVELVVHTDDLNAATGLDIPFDRQALAACTRLLADALAVKAPGGAVEVRIPPYAVVQCVEGPRHTRGTPPNVVETDPLTWIRLATGRTEWAAALDEARVSASGERADLSGLLPVMT